MKSTVATAVAIMATMDPAGAIAQVKMPDSLERDLWAENPARAFATLRRHPSLADCVNDDGTRPIHYAAQAGNVPLAKWLINGKVDVNAKTYNGFTPLHLAKNGEVARVLLRAGAKHDVRSSFGDRPIHMAADDALRGNYERVGVVVAIRATGEPMDIATALCLGKVDLARDMIRSGENRGGKVNGRNLLHIVAFTGDIATARLLVEYGASPNYGEYVGMNFGGKHTPLWEALLKDRREMVLFLLRNGADPTLLGDQYEHALNHRDPVIREAIFLYGSLYDGIRRFLGFKRERY